MPKWCASVIGLVCRLELESLIDCRQAYTAEAAQPDTALRLRCLYPLSPLCDLDRCTAIPTVTLCPMVVEGEEEETVEVTERLNVFPEWGQKHTRGADNRWRGRPQIPCFWSSVLSYFYHQASRPEDAPLCITLLRLPLKHHLCLNAHRVNRKSGFSLQKVSAQQLI